MSARVVRQLIARLLISVLLFAQLAVAAYACSVALPAPAAAPAEAGGQPADCHEASRERGRGDATSNLCIEHCRQGQQSEQTHVPVVPLVVLTGLYALLPTPVDGLAGGADPASACTLPAASPPHSIFHCCFRL